MNLTYKIGDITQETSGLIAHGCNCQGVMGSGVAGAIRNKWPIVFQRYNELFRGEPKSGFLGLTQYVSISPEAPLMVANCFTQDNYGNDGKQYASLEAVTKCLTDVFHYAHEFEQNTAGDIFTVKTVKIGCGLGGLNWDSQVLPVIDFLLTNVYTGVHVEIFDLA